MLEPRELDNRQLNPHLGGCAAKKQIPISPNWLENRTYR